ncbi:MAG TPA: hypothetical protein VE871_13725 [Longimicrobium sp.]|nr:hypothetical protein [Longimicrobium sp.]
MASPVSFLSRMPADLSRKLDRAEALAREALMDTHAELATDLVGILAPRMPFDEAIERYLESMQLEGEEKEAIGTRAVAILDEGHLQEDMAREGTRGWGWDWRYATPLGVLRLIGRVQKRSNEEELWLELAAARAEEKLVEEHIRWAMQFVELMDEHNHADPTRAVAHYIERLDVPELRARSVYQRVMARLAEDLLPRLPDEDGQAARS